MILENAREFVKCADNIPYFAEKYICNNTLMHSQYLILTSCQKSTDKIQHYISSRASGTTTILTVLALHTAIFQNDFDVFFYGAQPVIDTMMFNFSTSVLKKIPKYFHKGMTIQNRTMNFKNGSRVFFQPNYGRCNGNLNKNLLVIDDNTLGNSSDKLQNLDRNIYSATHLSAQNVKVICVETKENCFQPRMYIQS